jgi:hypothetical protein
MQKPPGKIEGRTVTVYLDADQVKRLEALKRTMGKENMQEGEEEALIWWLISRGLTAEEEWQQFLRKREG